MHSFEADIDELDLEDEDEDIEEEDEIDTDDVDAFIPLTQTFVRHEAPQELLDTFSRTSTRGVKLDFGLQTTLLAGGGRVRGDICLKFNHKAKKNRMTQISSIKLDCIGFEGKLPCVITASATEILTRNSFEGQPAQDVLQRRPRRPRHGHLPPRSSRDVFAGAVDPYRDHLHSLCHAIATRRRPRSL